MRGDVTGVALEHRLDRVPFLAQATGEPCSVALLREGREKPVLPFEDGWRSREAFARERGCKRATFRCASEMQTLDHAARTRKLDESRAEGTRDAERVRHAVRVELHEEAGHDRAAEHARQTRIVEADRFAGMTRGVADA